MYLGELKDGLEKIKNTREETRRLLARLDITGIKSLLCHYPRDWEDRSKITPLKDWANGQVCTTVKVLAAERFGRGYAKNLKVYVEDETSCAVLLCFNQHYLANKLVEGAEFPICGKFDYKSKYSGLQSSTFEICDNLSFARIVPVYPLTEKLTQSRLRHLVDRALELYADGIEDELPESIMLRDNLLSKADALRSIHYPPSFEELDRARKTLVYEELFYLQMGAARRVWERKKTPDDSADSGANSGAISGAAGGEFSPLQQRLAERLPFPLTSGQIKAVKEINRDMEGPSPMARLLQGDVGSGKTLVSFLACLKAVEEGGQAGIMAPTELLARQHAENAAKLLEPVGTRIAYLTGNIKSKGRSQLLSALGAGEVDLVIGTHALFSKDAVYKNLRLVVVDEQHRFGVSQRQTIMSKGKKTPHLLMMSATPIPRTLALTAFGDLDVSAIEDMPPGRKPVKTHLTKSSNAERAYDFVRKELSKGRQAYFVYPLIEASEAKDLKDAESMAKKLSKQFFPEYKTALIHSRLDEEEKRRIMEDFRCGNTKILAATSVVEVGVDVPNANCMVVEHAERFGLAALHQLRGRVGRGDAQSYCFLIFSDQDVPPEYAGMNAEDLSEENRSKEGKRLMVMLQHTNGFIIAEKDLQFRGPGQITGLQQSGYLALGIADPLRDGEELERARADAFALLKDDPGLAKPGHRRIAAVLETMQLFTGSGV